MTARRGRAGLSMRLGQPSVPYLSVSGDFYIPQMRAVSSQLRISWLAQLLKLQSLELDGEISNHDQCNGSQFAQVIEPALARRRCLWRLHTSEQ